MTKNFIINTVKHTTFWAMTCLIALIMTGCGGSDSGNDSTSSSHITIPLDYTTTTAPDSSGIQEHRHDVKRIINKKKNFFIIQINGVWGS